MKINKIKIGLALFVSSTVPLVTFAANKKLSDIIDLLIYYLDLTLVLLMGGAIVAFVYYVIKYFILPNADRSEAGSYVMYSVIGFFIILSFWGIVNVLQNTFGLKNENNRPASWASFSNLFPRGSGGSSSGSGFNGSGLESSNTDLGPRDFKVE